MTWRRAVRVWLLCLMITIQPCPATGACVKGHKSVHFMLPGYVTQPIHVNECRETSMSVISPVVALNSSGLTEFQRSFSTCCCAVGNTSLHQTELSSLDGRPSIVLLYRRIEECLCVACRHRVVITNNTPFLLQAR